MAKKQETKKAIVKCANKAEFRAYVDAFEECKMHHLFMQVISIATVPKAKRIIVEYVGDSWADDWTMVCIVLNDTMSLVA